MNRKRIAITGASGFVGKNLFSGLEDSFELLAVSRDRTNGAYTYEDLFGQKVECDVLIHLAGKAHDLKNSTEEKEYLEVNYELTKRLFTAFLNSTASTFIFMSSVKAVADQVETLLDEECHANPQTFYGKSKRLAEEHILNNLPLNKSVYILRPCIIHGPGNKGNLSLLYKLVSKNIPWPLADFENERSFCSIENLIFVIGELASQGNIQSGIYNVADDQPLSTNELIQLISLSRSKRPLLIRIPKRIVRIFARVGDNLKLPFNSERLTKLTENYKVNNSKIVAAIGKPLPVDVKNGLLNTFKSFE